MSGNQDGSGAPKHLIDDRAKGAFLAAIKGGALLRDAAAAAHQAALEHSYVRLEAEALRQRLEAQRRLADVLDQGLDPGGALAEEFDRVMKLLARWDRGNGKVGPRTVSAARSDSMSFDEAIALLAHRLTGLGHRIPGYPALEAPPADEGGAAEADANGD